MRSWVEGLNTDEMTDIPKVSVCVVTYNQQDYIAQCLQSILDQQVDFPFEVIVGDDCSTDNTGNIIRSFYEKYPNIIRPIFRDRNVGVFANYLEVHAAAVGEYVAHMDGDDYWLPGKMAYQAKILDENQSISQCWTCAELVDDNGVKVGVFPSKIARLLNPTKIRARDIALSYALVGHHSTQMYRKAKVGKELLRDEFLDYWIAFDNSLRGDAIYSKRILSVYRLGSLESITRNNKKKKMAVDLLAGHLLDIAKLHPSLACEAKANMFARRIMSYIKGHDLSAMNRDFRCVRDIPVKPLLVVKSLFYFGVQKLCWRNVRAMMSQLSFRRD